MHRVTRHRSGGANYGAGHNSEARTDARRDAEQLQHQRQREQHDHGDAGDRIVGGAHQAAEISGNRGREKTDNASTTAIARLSAMLPAQHHTEREDHREQSPDSVTIVGPKVGVLAR